MCFVLFHSTMEERLVRMVESKLINQSINQSTYTDVEEVLLVTKGVCKVECVIGCIHCSSCIVVFSTEHFSVHCQAWPIDCVGITLQYDILHSGSHDIFDGHPMYVCTLPLPHYGYKFSSIYEMIETSFVYGNLDLYIWWFVIINKQIVLTFCVSMLFCMLVIGSFHVHI